MPHVAALFRYPVKGFTPAASDPLVLVEAGLDAERRRRPSDAVTAFVADSPEGALVAEGPIVRCLATHADPDTGRRDLPVLTTLTRGLGQSEPTLGRLLLPVAGGGVIRVGDEVRPVRAAVA